MTGNGCPVCGGFGRVLAQGLSPDPVTVQCPECAGLALTPASADDPDVRVLAPGPRSVPRPAPRPPDAA